MSPQLCLWLCDKGNLQEVAYRPLLHAIDPPIKGSSQQGNLEEISESVYYRDGKFHYTVLNDPMKHPSECAD